MVGKRFPRWLLGGLWTSVALLVIVGVAAVTARATFTADLGARAQITLFGGIFLVAVSRAFLAIRARQMARHREWMIRAYAVAIGTSTVRVILFVLDLTVTPAGFSPRSVFVLSIWIGWILTLAAAELWITYTRPPAPALLPHLSVFMTGAHRD